MGIGDGTVGPTTKVLDNGPDELRWNLVIVGDGYRMEEITKYSTDVEDFLTRLRTTPPFDRLFHAINVYRVDVVSTQSGADVPAFLDDAAIEARTYFDARYWAWPNERILTVDEELALTVSLEAVPRRHNVLCIVNSPSYGGAGGTVPASFTGLNWHQTAIHELSHHAFNLADEYSSAGATTSPGEPPHPNVTRNTDRATNKWRALIAASTPMPSQCNPSCTTSSCVAPATPPAVGAVGAYEGAMYSPCNVYRPLPSCYMNIWPQAVGFPDGLAPPFCPVCAGVIEQSLMAYTGNWQLRVQLVVDWALRYWRELLLAAAIAALGTLWFA